MASEGHTAAAPTRGSRTWNLLRRIRRGGRLRWRLRGDARERFARIYSENHWHGQESRSGKGSSLAYTENLRRELPRLLERFEIRTVLDAPCGDFHWMRELVEAGDFQYIGADIVPEMIARLRPSEGPRVSFSVLDLTRDRFPDADLWLCRDCWFHLSCADILASLERFMASGIRYLLTTSHVPDGSFSNRDIRSGAFRRIDLFSPPFEFDAQPLAEIEDWIAPHPARFLYLWERPQLTSAVDRLRSALGRPG